MNPRPPGRAIVGVLIAAAIFTLIVVSQPSGGGGGRAQHVAFGGGLGDNHRQSGHPRQGPPHRHPQRHPRHHHARRRHHRRRHHPGPTHNGLIASHCTYHDPSSGACGQVPPPDSCTLRDHHALEDRSCTPGAVDPRVTQANIHSTICVSGYTTKVRPPTSYTSPLEDELIRSYGLALGPSSTELDHLVSLELGGAPADPRNLFPEPYAGRRGATDKDVLENRLHAEVCAGAISLARAQHEIVDWVRYQAPAAAPASPAASSNPSPPSGGGGSASNSRCDPNYSGACLDPNASDYDCAGGGGDGPKYVQGPIRVTGTDHFDLDGNGDGIACE